MSRLIKLILNIFYNIHSEITFNKLIVFQCSALYNKNLITTLHKNKNYFVENNC